jgi:hypothetical protein
MKVGVPVVPGTPGPVASYSDGDAFIKEHGFPGASLTSQIRLSLILTPPLPIKSSLRLRWEVVDVVCVL